MQGVLITGSIQDTFTRCPDYRIDSGHIDLMKGVLIIQLIQDTLNLHLLL